MATRRFETALSQEIFDMVKEMSEAFGMTAKGYVAMAISQRVMADKAEFARLKSLPVSERIEAAGEGESTSVKPQLRRSARTMGAK